MKKKLAMVLAVIMGMSVLSGCAQTAQSVSDGGGVEKNPSDGMGTFW